MNKWKYFLRSYFGFSQKETRGFILLTGTLFFTLFITIGLSKFYPETKQNTEQDKKILAGLINQTSKAEASDSVTSKEHIEPSMQFFNPNSIDEDKLVSIVGKKLSKTIVNYRKKGGVFYKKEDMLTIYGMDEEIYQKIKPWIKIDNVVYKSETEDKTIVLNFDINKADTSELQRLKGIGKVLAARIIKFRDKLGGFYSESQYHEVFGLTTDAIAELKNNTYIEKTFQPIKISLNNSTSSALFSHPYIGKEFSPLILKYKKERGSFKNIEELKSIKEISEEAYMKILPYVTL